MTQELEPPNGKTTKKEKIPDLLSIKQSADTQNTLKDIRNMMRGNVAEERTKFTIAEGLQDFDKVPHFTEYRDFNEVLRMNKLEIHIEFVPKVFGDTPKVQGILDIFRKHRDQHKINMRAYQRKGEKAIVDILRSDNGEIIQPKGWEKFTGIRK